MKKRVTVVICIILVALCSFSSSGIFVDGYNNGTEWKDTDFNILFNSTEQSKCDVEYADIRVVLENGNTVSVLFQAIDLSFNEDISAVRFGINGNFYTLIVDGRSRYSNVEYSVNYETAKYNNDYVLEAKFFFSETVAEGTEMSVTVTDGKGTSSSRRIVKIHSIYQQLQPETTERTVKTTSPKTTKVPKTTTPKTTKAPKTTKPKTTKPKVTSSGSLNKSKKTTRKSFWNIGSGNKYDNTEGDEYIASEQQAVTDSPQFDLTDGNVQNSQRYKFLAAVLIFLLLLSATIIMAIPALRKKENSDTQNKNKEDNNK